MEFLVATVYMDMGFVFNFYLVKNICAGYKNKNKCFFL